MSMLAENSDDVSTTIDGQHRLLPSTWVCCLLEQWYEQHPSAAPLYHPALLSHFYRKEQPRVVLAALAGLCDKGACKDIVHRT